MWLSILVASEAWGCPPWEVAGGLKIVWFFRWQEYKKELARKERMSGE